MAPVSGCMMEKRGVKKTLFFGGFLQIFGAWIRFFGDFVDSTPESPGGRDLLVTSLRLVLSLSF